MADFPTCYAFVLPNEDDTPPRYATVPDPTEADLGAQAISGINSAAFPARFAAIVALAQAARGPAVESFYLSTYWNGWICQLQNAIAMRVMDAEVNHGDSVGVRLLQRACNALGPGVLEVDGLWGPLTLDAALSENVVNLVHLFQGARVSFLRTAALTNPIVARDLAQLIARASK